MRSRRLPISSALRDKAFPSLMKVGGMLFSAREYLPKGYSALVWALAAEINRHNHPVWGLAIRPGNSPFRLSRISQARTQEGFRVYVRTKRNRRSLRCATPDFPLDLVASVNFMRLSLMKAAHVVVSSAARQEIRVRSGRDDNST